MLSVLVMYRNGTWIYTKKFVLLHGKSAERETAKFLTQIDDLFADILSENSLKGNANNIAAIFLLKALYGSKDSQQIELVNGTPPHDTPTVDEIALRAGLLEN